MKKIYPVLLFVMAALSQVQAQRAARGVIQIQIQSEADPQIQQAQQAQGGATAQRLQTGISRFDELNSRFGAVRMRRLFPDAGSYEALHRKAGLHLWYELYFDETADVDDVVKAYAEVGEVARAGKVYPVHRTSRKDEIPAPAATVNDPLFDLQWHYHNTDNAGVDINLPEAWDVHQGSADVIVAVIDEGIDAAHPDLANAMWSGVGKNFVSKGKDIVADDHGTHVAGIIGAVTNNGTGVSGIAGGAGAAGGVRLMSCQIFEYDEQGTSLTGSIYEALVYAADNGAVVCQNSWGYDSVGIYNKADSAAIRYFIDHAGKNGDGSPRAGTPMTGGVVIFAAGNENSSGKWYPAYFDDVVSVAAVGFNGEKTHYSNYGSWVDIAAPGGDMSLKIRRGVLSTISQNSYMYLKERESTVYGWMQGTSMACPHVSGVAALILSKYGHERYTPDSLRLRLLGSARSLLPYEPVYAKGMGSGLLDAAAALGTFIHVSGIALAGCPDELTTSAPVALSATVVPENAFDRQILWSAGNPGVATVTPDGIITPKAEGTVVVTAATHDGGYQAQCTIHVRQSVTGIRLDTVIRLVAGNTGQIYAKIIPDNAYLKAVAWSVDNTRIASIDAQGAITAKEAGSAMITATTADGGHTATAPLEVYAKAHAPEGFTPNGDGVNDYFKLTTDNHERYALKVFDRAGQVHYQSSDYRNEWDGTAGEGSHAGRKVPAGTYFYILTAKNSNTTTTGFVVIKY
ncbi:MAG: S8 family serine peptidase [Prevotellaceae bacterium]|jgi:gliding motility-associated-like protein|nr:S8 family serine peptidase [Prevotellaceae bacterium]